MRQQPEGLPEISRGLSASERQRYPRNVVENRTHPGRVPELSSRVARFEARELPLAASIPISLRKWSLPGLDCSLISGCSPGAFVIVGFWHPSRVLQIGVSDDRGYRRCAP